LRAFFVLGAWKRLILQQKYCGCGTTDILRNCQKSQVVRQGEKGYASGQESFVARRGITKTNYYAARDNSKYGDIIARSCSIAVGKRNNNNVYRKARGRAEK